MTRAVLHLSAMLWDAAQLEALAAVVAEGSFDAAARVLHITPSAVSQRIRALENAAGSVLVRRSRPVAPTESGGTLLRLARQVALLSAEASAQLGADGRAPVVPLAVTADSLATWLLPALAQVPDVAFDLRRVDSERAVDLLLNGVVMAAITSSPDAVQGCSATPLGRMRYVPVATPQFVDRWFADGLTPSSLGAAPTISYDRDDDLQDVILRARRRGAGVTLPPRHFVPGSHDFVEAVRLGMGWGMVPELQAAPLVAGGEFVVIAPDAVVDVALYLQQWRLRSDVLDRVGVVLRDAAATALRPIGRKRRGG